MKGATEKLTYYILENAKADNFYEILVQCARKFPNLSPAFIEEITKEVYNLNGWRNDKHTSKPSRLIKREARKQQWEQLFKAYYGEDYDPRGCYRASKDKGSS